MKFYFVIGIVTNKTSISYNSFFYALNLLHLQ
jgi:hypothetical protein